MEIKKERERRIRHRYVLKERDIEGEKEGMKR